MIDPNVLVIRFRESGKPFNAQNIVSVLVLGLWLVGMAWLVGFPLIVCCELIAERAGFKAPVTKEEQSQRMLPGLAIWGFGLVYFASRKAPPGFVGVPFIGRAEKPWWTSETLRLTIKDEFWLPWPFLRLKHVPQTEEERLAAGEPPLPSPPEPTRAEREAQRVEAEDERVKAEHQILLNKMKRKTELRAALEKNLIEGMRAVFAATNRPVTDSALRRLPDTSTDEEMKEILSIGGVDATTNELRALKNIIDDHNEAVQQAER